MLLFYGTLHMHATRIKMHACQYATVLVYSFSSVHYKPTGIEKFYCGLMCFQCSLIQKRGAALLVQSISEYMSTPDTHNVIY